MVAQLIDFENPTYKAFLYKLIFRLLHHFPRLAIYILSIRIRLVVRIIHITEASNRVSTVVILVAIIITCDGRQRHGE